MRFFLSHVSESPRQIAETKKRQIRRNSGEVTDMDKEELKQKAKIALVAAGDMAAKEWA